MDYRVEQFGAVADGVHDDGPAIQAAINAASANGGGRVLLSPGAKYRSRPLELRSGVELRVDAGATLQAVWTMEEFCQDGSAQDSPSLGFINMDGVRRVAISGTGIIDGNGSVFYTEGNRYHRPGKARLRRPRIICARDCRDVIIQDVVLQNSPFWTIHPLGCARVTIRGVHIMNPLHWANTDGIDPDHCRDVRIQGCTIETADDGIAIKNTWEGAGMGPTENIEIIDCSIVSTSAAIKVGSESEDAFRHITAARCVIARSHRGLCIQLRDGGEVEGVQVNDLAIETRRFHRAWWGAAEPIHISVRPRTQQTLVGLVRDVQLKNLVCRSENGVFVDGGPGYGVEHLTLEHLVLHWGRWSRWPDEGYDMRPGVGPDRILPSAAGICIRQARGVSVRDVVVRCVTEHPITPQIIFDAADVRDLAWTQAEAHWT